MPMSRPPGAPSPDENIKPSTCNLYVNSLPKEITDDKLVQIFGTFGDIESARVMVDLSTRISKGYGFVKFRSHEAGMLACACSRSIIANVSVARNAIQSMNGFQMGANTLTVKAANENVTGATSSNSIPVMY
jgi:RNA recognition motif-containing protein